MNVQIKVRVVRTQRDGAVLKWRDRAKTPRQENCRGTTQRAQEAERAAKERELNDETRDELWADFYADYKANELCDCSKSHVDKCDIMDRRLVEAAEAKGIKTLRCSDISKKLISHVEARMRSRAIEKITIKSYMATLWGILTFGQDEERLPIFRKKRKRRTKRTKQEKNKSKGRALSGEEFDRLIDAIKQTCKSHEPQEPFVTAAIAAKLLGMRKSETWLFAWEPIEGAHYPIRLDRSNPAIKFSDEQKSGNESEVPLTPEAAQWLRGLPRGESPWVCRTTGQRGPHKTPDRLGRVIADAGRKAGIVVKRTIKPDGQIKIKFASMHDLRRTYAAAMLSFLNVPDTQKMTRHADPSVLLDFYADIPTPELFQRVSGGFSGGSESRSNQPESEETS